MFMSLQSSTVFAHLIWSFKSRTTRNVYLSSSDYSPYFQWYWTWDKKSGQHLSVMRSMGTVMVFHLGTLALGSLVLAVVRSKKCEGRILFWPIRSKFKFCWINEMTHTHSLNDRVVIVGLDFLHKRFRKMDNSISRWP